MEQTFDFAPTLLVRDGAVSNRLQLSCVTGNPIDDGLCRLVAFTKDQRSADAIMSIFDGRCSVVRDTYFHRITLCCEPEHVEKIDTLYNKTRERGNLVSKAMVKEIFCEEATFNRRNTAKKAKPIELTLA